MSAPKLTRKCVICGEEKLKSTGVFGPKAKQVACKGECLKKYEQVVRARRSAQILPPATMKFAQPNELDEVMSLFGSYVAKPTYK